jgi:PAS domain S-box-containing protein
LPIQEIVVAVALLALLGGFAAGAVARARVAHRSAGRREVDDIDRLHRAEVTLAEAASTEAAARELADHAVALLGAPSAVVIIEGLGDTVRVTAGDPAAANAVYAPGSRMRLLQDAGTPCGSIAVAARADGRPYDEREERVLDALADRVSSTLHRLSLFDVIGTERRMLADVVGSSSDGIFAVGPDLQVRSWNPAMERLVGLPAADAVGRHCCQVFRPLGEDGEPKFGAACPGRAGAFNEAVSLRLVGDGGPDRWLTATFSPLSAGGYVVIARDVTERKRLDDEKADFLATVSHELRTPLTPIKGYLQTLARRDEEFTPEDRRRIYNVVLEEERRLERLVHQLLQATSLDHDQADAVAVAPLEWDEAVRGQIDRFRREAPDREVEVVIQRNLPVAVADPHLAEQALVNVLQNAARFSPPGSPIRVDVRRRRGAIVTTVTDAGPGVPAEDRSRIFDRFTRLGDHLTRAEPGVGLGLYIARRSLERMGGTIDVDAAEGGGAAFTFTLPAAAASRRREPVTTP